MRRRGRSLEDDRARITGTGFAPPGPCGRACGRDDGRILVTVGGVDIAPAGRGGDVEGAVAVEPDLSQLRLPAPGEQRASRQQNRRGGARARTCRWPAQVASRLAAGAESTESGRRGSGHRARAASCACACTMRTGLARAAAGPTRSCAACLAAGRAGGHTYGGLVSLGGEEFGDDVDRGVDRFSRILVPRGASILMCALGGWCACGEECAVAGLSC